MKDIEIKEAVKLVRQYETDLEKLEIAKGYVDKAALNVKNFLMSCESIVDGDQEKVCNAYKAEGYILDKHVRAHIMAFFEASGMLRQADLPLPRKVALQEAMSGDKKGAGGSRKVKEVTSVQKLINKGQRKGARQMILNWLYDRFATKIAKLVYENSDLITIEEAVDHVSTTALNTYELLYANNGRRKSANGGK